MSEKQYKILDKKEEKGELTLTVEASADFINSFKEASIKEYKADLEIDGFRKGQAPDKMVEEKVGEMALMERSAYKALNNIVPLIITEEKIEALTQPSISITKISPDNPVEFKIQVTLMPKIELPDYKALAKEVKKDDADSVSEEELNEYIDYIRTQRRDALAMAKNDKIDKDAPLPELDDAFVKSLGNFKDVDDFKKQLSENMKAEKEQKSVQKHRLAIIEKIISETKVDIPQMLIDQELDHMMHKFRHDIENMKMEFDDYLKQLKKTEEDLKKEWKVDAEKRIKMNLILPQIAKEEKLKADEEEIKSEVEKLKKHEPNLNEAHAMMYVSNVLMNEEVFKFLEKLSK